MADHVNRATLSSVVTRDNYQIRAREELREMLPIFFASTKKQLLDVSKTIGITDRGMVMLICNSSLFGFNHALASWEWQPPHLQPDENTMQKIRSGNDAERLRRLLKIARIFDERCLFTGHLFWNTTVWHLLFFDQRDRARTNNHWKFGPHIHFLNYLVRPNSSVEQIANELDTERPRLKSAIHIRYSEVTREQLRAESEQDRREADLLQQDG